MKTTRVIGIVGLSAAAGASLEVPEAQALWRRVNPSVCFIDAFGGGIPIYILGGTAAGLANVDEVHYTHPYCMAPNDSWLPIDKVVTLEVYGADNNTAADVHVQACTTYTAGGGDCGQISSSSGTGNYSLSPDLTYWGATTVNDNPYIYVQLPPKERERPASTLRGFLMRDS